MMRARLQRHVDGGATRVTRIGQRVDFGVPFAGARMKTLADDLAIPDHDATDDRIGPGCIASALRKFERPRHVRDVVG